jgi:hypothetical protein
VRLLITDLSKDKRLIDSDVTQNVDRVTVGPGWVGFEGPQPNPTWVLGWAGFGINLGSNPGPSWVAHLGFKNPTNNSCFCYLRIFSTCFLYFYTF